MTIDECIIDYVSSARVVLTKKNVRDIVNMLLDGETITNTARKLKIKVCNVSNVRNVFEDKCGLVFPNAKRNYKKNASDSFCKIELNNEEDILTLIENNQFVRSTEIRKYIAESFNIPFDKATKLYSEYMTEFCRFKGDDKNENERKLEKYISKSKFPKEIIFEIIERVNLGEERKKVGQDLGLTIYEMQGIVRRLRELSFIDKSKTGRPAKC